MSTPSRITQVYGPDYQFFRANPGPGNSFYPTPPWAVLENFNAFDLCIQERHLCTVLLNYRYSLAKALITVDFLADKVGLGIRQTQRWIAKLITKELIKIVKRPGRINVIDVSPLVEKVKALPHVNPAKEEPAPEVETLAEVVTEEEEDGTQWWLDNMADSTEDALADGWEEAEEPELNARLDWQRLMAHIEQRGKLSKGELGWFSEARGMRWRENVLHVAVPKGEQVRQLERFEPTINLAILDVFGYGYGVQFERAKQLALVGGG